MAENIGVHRAPLRLSQTVWRDGADYRTWTRLVMLAPSGPSSHRCSGALDHRVQVQLPHVNFPAAQMAQKRAVAWDGGRSPC
ncbi:hypothetical protein AGIG_G15704 [Arapaima gigas]